MIAPTQQAPTRRRAILTLIVALSGCVAGGGTDGSDGPSSHVTLSTVPSMSFLTEGGTARVTVNVARAGYDGALTFSVSGLPTGVTAAFSPDVLTAGAASSSLTLTAATDAPVSSGALVLRTASAGGDTSFVILPLTVSRPQMTVLLSGTGSGTVTSNPAGINCGGGCSTSFAYGTNITLTAAPASGSAFAGWSGGGCSGTATCGLTLSANATVTATFNSTAQGFSFAVAPTTASVPQGGNTTATANITRANGYAGAVSLALTGAPSGLTITVNPASITGNNATLNIASTSAMAAGNYPITVSATGAGIAGTQTATLNVQVTPAQGGSGNVAISFAACDASALPLWFAVQNGTGAWTRVTAGPSNAYTFAVGSTGGVAFVTPGGGGFGTSVFYGSHDDIVSIALGSPCSGLNASGGTKHLTGTIASVPTNGFATVAIGGASTDVHPLQGPTYTLDGVPPGRRDLIAAVSIPNSNGTTQFSRLILRRNVDYSASVPQLSFVGDESVAAAVAGIGIPNRGSDQTSASASFVTANGSSAPYASSLGGPNGVGYAGVPDSLLQPGDLHAIFITAMPATGSSARVAIVLHHSVVQDTVMFGPALSQPTVTSIGASPYLRLRAQLASQSEYNTAANAEFNQGVNSVAVTTTAAYLGALPPNWTLDIPDFSSAGYDPTWGLKSGSSVDWDVLAAGGNAFLPLLGATPVDGDRLLGAQVGNTSASFNRLDSFAIWRRRSPIVVKR